MDTTPSGNIICGPCFITIKADQTDNLEFIRRSIEMLRNTLQ